MANTSSRPAHSLQSLQTHRIIYKPFKGWAECVSAGDGSKMEAYWTIVAMISLSALTAGQLNMDGGSGSGSGLDSGSGTGSVLEGEYKHVHTHYIYTEIQCVYNSHTSFVLKYIAKSTCFMQLLVSRSRPLMLLLYRAVQSSSLV